MRLIENTALANALYRACYVLGFVLIFVFNFFYAGKYRIRRGKALLFTLTSYALIFGWSYVLAWAANGFTWGHHNAIRVYIWFPLVLLVTGKIFHIDFKTCCEFVTPSTCIVYGVARLGCVFAGCCHGCRMERGIFSAAAGYRCFPVQLCEAVTALAIAALTVLWAGKKEYRAEKNDLYPKMLVLYGGTRFLWEFAADNEKVIWRISELALWALATCLLGAIWLLISAQKAEQKKLIDME